MAVLAVDLAGRPPQGDAPVLRRRGQDRPQGGAYGAERSARRVDDEQQSQEARSPATRVPEVSGPLPAGCGYPAPAAA
ncbi:hypothetical protein [Streptomyces sp. NPDC008122]|uniref:hypothetical protein n=1 Tax=Streptomyces sp. NPDC008122 TaxID=3364810 RepID=UPI0036E1B4B8